MTAAAPSPPHRAPRRRIVVWTGLAFVYWLVCMTALEPGNLAGMLDAGMRPDWVFEGLRLTAAAALGASATPALTWLAKRAPIDAGRTWRNLALQAAAVLLLTLVLILVSSLLAAWLRDGRLLPRAEQVSRELFANGLLVAACLAGFLGLLQIPPRQPAAAPLGSAYANHLSIAARGRVVRVEVAAVDWIEAQGNYQALHVGPAVHLLRETLASLSARLDPGQFQRIHRRVIVAVDRVAEVEPLANGDGLVRLRDGTELRLARGFRADLHRRLQI
jgi:DNA-binding LytR/AlgR family response regulator